MFFQPSLIKHRLKLKLARQREVHPIYIVPTIDGLKVLGLNLLLLIIGLIYANNFVLLFNFILFCLFLASMFYTHFNLKGLELKNIKSQSTFAKDLNSLILNFSTTNNLGHYHIQTEIITEIDLIQNSNAYFDYTNPTQGFTFENQYTINRRGTYEISDLLISTTFPLNFFKAFTVFHFKKQISIYPERIDYSFNQTKETIGSNIDEQEDFQHEKYISGESLKRIDWKKFAKTNKLLIKKDVSQSFDEIDIIINFNELTKEQALSQASYNIHLAHSLGCKYNIIHGDLKISYDENQSTYYHKCLSYVGNL